LERSKTLKSEIRAILLLTSLLFLFTFLYSVLAWSKNKPIKKCVWAYAEQQGRVPFAKLKATVGDRDTICYTDGEGNYCFQYYESDSISISSGSQENLRVYLPKPLIFPPGDTTTTAIEMMDSLKILRIRMDERVTQLEEELKQARKADTIYIVGCTVKEADSLVRVPDVSLNFYFEAVSVDSLSDTSGVDGKFIIALPIGVNNHLIIYEARKESFRPVLDSVTVSQNPFLLRIPLTQEFPTRTVSVEIKARYKTNWEKGLPDRTLVLKWGGEIQRTYETNKYDKRHKLGFIPAVEVPQGNQVVEFQVSHGSAVERDWEPVISSKIPDEWKILIERPK